MVGTRHLSALVGATDAAGAKLVLVGDPRQLPEIEAGGALGALVRRHGAIELTENRRQHEPWERFALDALRLGRAEVALATYEQAGRVHIGADDGGDPDAAGRALGRVVQQGSRRRHVGCRPSRGGRAQRSGPGRPCARLAGSALMSSSSTRWASPSATGWSACATTDAWG